AERGLDRMAFVSGERRGDEEGEERGEQGAAPRGGRRSERLRPWRSRSVGHAESFRRSGGGGIQEEDFGLGLLRGARRDPANGAAGLAKLAAAGEDGRGRSFGDDEDVADAHVEGAEHFGGLDRTTAGDFGED